MRIAVIGATGVAGRAFTPLATAAGHTLSAHRADIFDMQQLSQLVDGCDAAVNLATAIPKAGGSWARNDRIRREGTANVIAACLERHVPVLLQQSVAMLNCASDAVAQNEEDPIQGYAVLESALDMEAIARSSPLDVRLLRGGMFYGPGTGRPERWQQELEDEDFRLPGDGSAWISPVHVEDYARAILAVLEVGSPRETYIACDDSPLQWRDLYSGMSRQLALTVPAAGGPLHLRSFRTGNLKLRTLGWKPRHRVLEPYGARKLS